MGGSTATCLLHPKAQGLALVCIRSQQQVRGADEFAHCTCTRTLSALFGSKFCCSLTSCVICSLSVPVVLPAENSYAVWPWEWAPLAWGPEAASPEQPARRQCGQRRLSPSHQTPQKTAWQLFPLPLFPLSTASSKVHLYGPVWTLFAQVHSGGGIHLPQSYHHRRCPSLSNLEDLYRKTGNIRSSCWIFNPEYKGYPRY